jgi:hypothetical protein
MTIFPRSPIPQGHHHFQLNSKAERLSGLASIVLKLSLLLLDEGDTSWLSKALLWVGGEVRQCDDSLGKGEKVHVAIIRAVDRTLS